MRKRRSWEGRGEDGHGGKSSGFATPRQAPGAGLFPARCSAWGGSSGVTGAAPAGLQGAAGELLGLEGFQTPPVSRPVPHSPSRRRGRKARDATNPRALGNRQVPALPAAGVGDKSEATRWGPGGEPRLPESRAPPRLLAFASSLPSPSDPPNVRKEPGASHRQKWQDLEL